MTRVASLFLPHWPIDRLRRADRARAPRPEVAPASLDALGRIAADERASQCSVPATPGWRPGARWARAEEGTSRAAVEAAVAALPAHRRPPQRELGRTSEAVAAPFGASKGDQAGPHSPTPVVASEACAERSRGVEGRAPGIAMSRRRSTRTEDGIGSDSGGTAPDTVAGNAPAYARWSDEATAAAIEALPPHRRPPLRELSRRSQLAAAPFGASSQEVPARSLPPLPFVPSAVEGQALRAAGGSIFPDVGPGDSESTPSPPAHAAPMLPRTRMPPVSWPGEDARGRAELRAPRPARRPARRPTSRDGHAGEANGLPAPSLARLARMPSVARPGEGPHPDDHACPEPCRGGRLPETHPGGQNRFFQTGRTLGSLVARVCPEDGGGEHDVAAASALPPLVTVTRTGSRVTIAAACPAALALGLVPGMALTQARASVPRSAGGLDVRDADPAGDAADLHRLALTLARRWTPVVAPAGADGLTLDLAGVAHLHGGEARMARRLVRLLARHGVAARIAVADTAAAAWGLARFGRPVAVREGSGRARGGPQPGGNGRGTPGWSHDEAATVAGGDRYGDAVLIVPPGGHADALAPLPVAALRLETRAADLLARLGVATVGQLAAMPRGPLARRFGPGLVARLDQASGALPEPLDPVVPRDPVAVRRSFAEPIATADAIAHWLGALVPDLAAALTQAGLGARLVELVADRVDGVPQRLRIGLARPTRDAAHLLRLLARRIEEVEPGYGIDALALHVRRADPLGPETLGARLAEEAAPDLAPLVDALANRIGAGRLWRCSPVESDVPERSVAGVPPLDPPPGEARAPAADDVRRLDERARDHPWHPRWPRPVRLLRRPEPVDNVLAGLPDQPPARFTWRGRTHRVVRADGPERIAGEWWRRPGERQAVRDYFQVEDEAGARFWLYRRGDGMRGETGDLAWFLHGRFG